MLTFCKLKATYGSTGKTSKISTVGFHWFVIWNGFITEIQIIYIIYLPSFL